MGTLKPIFPILIQTTIQLILTIIKLLENNNNKNQNPLPKIKKIQILHIIKDLKAIIIGKKTLFLQQLIIIILIKNRINNNNNKNKYKLLLIKIKRICKLKI